ncbi:MAG: hypothetical protein LLG15_08700 [Betaproteobacteria bacterium]|nr:hypothetical protein [Betaproteobacteria bacterium]
MSIRTCYMCELEATSDEHTPPKCLFPERKDVPDGIDYRVNLITVPSCEEHNSSKSHDDEYLLHVLSGSFTSSPVGLTQFMSKVRRAFEKVPSKATSFIRRSEPILLKRHTEDEWEQGAQVIVEAQRLDLVLGNCARALYFHETEQKFVGPVQVITAFTMYSDTKFQANVTSSVDTTRTYFASHPPKGENPSVFWYKFEESANTAIFFMCFYSSSEVLVRLDKREQP